jgi:hypothetical protein
MEFKLGHYRALHFVDSGLLIRLFWKPCAVLRLGSVQGSPDPAK